ncbi:hypothetical protein Hdeb2414_s0001g00016591 [Helianthus debilis subsp. tardiflorus]
MCSLSFINKYHLLCFIHIASNDFVYFDIHIFWYECYGFHYTEQAAITLLNNVDLNVDDYTIRIRIVRLWTRSTFNNPRKIYCYDMIFME